MASILGNRSPGEYVRVKWKKFLKPKLIDKSEDVWQALWRSVLAEFFGTLIFVFLGTGSAVAALNLSPGGNLNTGGLVAISCGFGFGLTVVIYAVGEISGGHINPAVTWATLMTGRLSVIRAFLYWAAQLVGAITGSAILRSIVRGNGHQFNGGCNGIASWNNAGHAFGAETMFTFIFIFIVFATAISPFVGKIAPLAGGGSDYGPGKLTPLAVGLTILSLHLVAIPLTGAGFNPARSFGPAVVYGYPCWKNHWVYWVGPLLGSTVASTVATLIFLAHPNAIRNALKASRGDTKYEHDVKPVVEHS